jgi:hypothetical protein
VSPTALHIWPGRVELDGPKFASQWNNYSTRQAPVFLIEINKEIFHRSLDEETDESYRHHLCFFVPIFLTLDKPLHLKGTVSQDFSLLVFFINQFPPSYRVSH